MRATALALLCAACGGGAGGAPEGFRVTFVLDEDLVDLSRVFTFDAHLTREAGFVDAKFRVDGILVETVDWDEDGLNELHLQWPKGSGFARRFGVTLRFGDGREHAASIEAFAQDRSYALLAAGDRIFTVPVSGRGAVEVEIACVRDDCLAIDAGVVEDGAAVDGGAADGGAREDAGIEPDAGPTRVPGPPLVGETVAGGGVARSGARALWIEVGHPTGAFRVEAGSRTVEGTLTISR